MNLPMNTEQLPRLIFIIIIFYIIVRMIRFFIKGGPHKKSKGKVDGMLEELIQAKRTKIINTTSSPENYKVPKSGQFNIIKSHFQNLLKNEKREELKTNYQFFLNLIKDINWGDGKSLKNIYSEYQFNSLFPIPPRYIKQAVVNEFNNFNLDEAPDKTSFIRKINYIAFINYISANEKLIENSIFNKLAKTWKISKVSVSMAFYHVKLQGTEHDFKNLIETNIKDPNEIKNYVQKIDKNDFFTHLIEKFNSEESILDKLKEVSSLYDSLIPLPLPTNEQDALAILELDIKNKELAKKSYKNLCKKYHPDRLAGFKISAKMLKRSNENFASIKKAFDIISKT